MLHHRNSSIHGQDPFDRFGESHSMSSSSANEEDEYALVSSFYGPGATGGWYLTALASLISWALHPRKRRVDSITADTIAVVAFPTAAAAHLISQVWSYPGIHQGSHGLLAQSAASIEAALTVTETFLAMDVILFLLAVGFKCVRRGCMLAAAGLFCFSAECYLYFSRHVRQAIKHNLDRPFLIDFGGILISVMVVLLLCIAVALSLIVFFFAMRPATSQARPFDQDAEATRNDQERDFQNSSSALALTWVTMLFLPCSFIASTLPLYSGAFVDSPHQFLPWLRAVASRIGHDLIPTSNISAKDLDQALAIIAGANVLGFSLYSTAHSYYQARLLRTRARPQQRGIELMTHSRIQPLSH